MGITDLPTQLADLENRTVMAGLIKTISSEPTLDGHRHSVTLIAQRGVSGWAMFVDPDKLAEPGQSHIRALQTKIFEEVERNGTLDGLLNSITPGGFRVVHVTDADMAAMDDDEGDEDE